MCFKIFFGRTPVIVNAEINTQDTSQRRGIFSRILRFFTREEENQIPRQDPVQNQVTHSLNLDARNLQVHREQETHHTDDVPEIEEIHPQPIQSSESRQKREKSNAIVCVKKLDIYKKANAYHYNVAKRILEMFCEHYKNPRISNQNNVIVKKVQNFPVLAGHRARPPNLGYENRRDLLAAKGRVSSLIDLFENREDVIKTQISVKAPGKLQIEQKYIDFLDKVLRGNKEISASLKHPYQLLTLNWSHIAQNGPKDELARLKK